jgi:hypothetical protein
VTAANQKARSGFSLGLVDLGVAGLLSLQAPSPLSVKRKLNDVLTVVRKGGLELSRRSVLQELPMILTLQMLQNLTKSTE